MTLDRHEAIPSRHSTLRPPPSRPMKRPRAEQPRHRSVRYHVSFVVWLLSVSASSWSRMPCDAFQLQWRPLTKHREFSELSGTEGRRLFATADDGLIQSSVAALDHLTVKQLRELVKQRSVERGILSKLTRKKDLIEYLQTEKTRSESSAQATPSVVPSHRSRGGQSPAAQTRDAAPGGRKSDEPVEARMKPSNKQGLPAVQPSQVKKQPTRLPPLASSSMSLGKNTKGTFVSPKEAVIQDVFRRYPPVKEEMEALEQQEALDSLNTTNDFVTTDMRQIFHPMLMATRNVSASSDMDLVFVGTASCTPGVTRGVSCTALRLNWRRRGFHVSENIQKEAPQHHQSQGFQGGTWLFDVGECTQLQIQRTNCIRPSKITKIFLTHAHGDHSFGLPGLLCLMGQDRDREASKHTPIDIYGPEGLRLWLRVAIRYSVSRIVPPYRVHELMNVPTAPEWLYSQRSQRFFRKGWTGQEGQKRWIPQGLAGEDGLSWISQAKRLNLEPSSLFGEVEGGRDIYPVYDHSLSSGGAPVWEVEDEGDVKVYAAPMSHGIPCLGYVVEELPRPGRLRNELVEPMVRSNFDALKKAGFRVPMKAMAVIKNLEPGAAFTFPDGTVVTHEEALEAPRAGRKVVICGDTADSRALHKLAENADVVVHEATNSYLSGIDRETSLRDVTRDAVVHGHSTPQIAGAFARRVKAKRLVLNHFSARYKGDISADSLSIMMRIERQAMRTAMLDETQVAAAWDFMLLPIPRH